MPKGRPLQSSVGQRPGPRLAARAKMDAKSLAREEEKENIGIQSTASRRHRRSGVLGATTTLGISSIASKPIHKGFGKPKPSRVKEEKLPLQDITSKFLPAPEFANRGVGSESGSPNLPIHEPSYQTTTSLRSNLLSPLPPSSPPADLLLSPVKSCHLGSRLLDSGDDHDNQPHIPFLLDSEHDLEHKRPTSSSSDPFGFVALEKKLKEERTFVTNMLEARVDVDDDIYEELHDIPVADTSSPRPIRRVKQSLTCSEGEHQPSEYEDQDEAIGGAPGLLAHPWFFTPPTPHKDKRVQRRLSCEGQDIFSPCSSSLRSSPSPTKTSASKRRREILYGQDPLEEFNTTIDETGGNSINTDKLISKRKCPDLQKQSEGHQNTATWNLRPRRATTAQKASTLPKPPKSVSRAKLSRKAKSNSTKKISDAVNDDDLEEKSRQDREERIKYFERLTEYSVEKENVYII